MRTAHCEGEDLAHADCPAPLACSCPGHLSDGNRAREQAILAELEPIRGAQLPPKAAPVVDQLPRARPVKVRAGTATSEADSRPRDVTVDAPEFPAGVFSHGITDLIDPVDPPKETPMARGGIAPATDCPDCGEHFTTGQGLGAHRRFKKCPGVRVAAPSTPPSREPAMNGGTPAVPDARNVSSWTLHSAGGARLGQIDVALDVGIFDLSRDDRDRVFEVVDAIQAATG